MNTAIEELWGPDEEQALLDSIDAWVEKSVAPIAREYDLEDKYPHELVEEMKELGLFGAKLYPERDESVEIDADAEFPPELCNDPKPPTPSKTKIKAAIKRGEAIAGARIVRKDRLSIT